MGQTNLKRTQFVPRATIVSLQNSNVQTLDFSGYLEVADTVDIVDVDGNGCITGVIADNMAVLAINRANNKVVLDASVDTSLATGTPKMRVQNIDDGQESIDRLYRRKFSGPVNFNLTQNVLESRADEPSLGKTTLFVDDVSFFRVGDDAKVIDDTGVVLSSVSIDSVNVNADDINYRASIVINSSVTLNGANNPYIQNTSIDMSSAVRRNQERIDEIDRPIVNQYLGVGNCSQLAFEFPELFVQSTSKVFLDSGRKRKGTAGTRATLLQGSADSAITFESMILGTDGNKTNVEVVSAAGIAVTVSGNSKSGYLITVTDNTGTITSKELADAVNSHVEAKRIVQAIYGGNGTGVVSPFGPSSLAGGLNDGSGDYAELEQVWENKNVGTGLKWVSFHVRPNERNRMNSAPDNDEEITVDYSKASVNTDR